MLSDRMGLMVRVIDRTDGRTLPAVIVLYYAVGLPLCGVPAKLEGASPTTIATIVSTMLNSIWTMFVLYWELCGCNKKISNAECYCTVIRTVYESPKLMSICYCGWCGCVTTSNCGCVCLGNCQVKNSTSTESRVIMKICNGIGKTIMFSLIFAIFTGIFILSAMTIGVAFQYQIFERSTLHVGPLTKSIQAGKIGPGLDSQPDGAMFVTMVYELPNWYHVGLYDNRNVNIAKSASVHQIQNRLYFGQFNELEHLKDGALMKSISCDRIFPFLHKINKTFFQWKDSQILNTTDFSKCKLMFRLWYHPTNNDWNPFINFFHKMVNFLTIDWGIFVQDSETCPTGFQPLPVSSLLD